ncbi:MAG: phosphonate ABC transporter, permease protein PhnE [Candidatus Epulonipiscium fishelsonii]|nr:MAG: phosphonate ABC transporter, permease protein PhnE [Epulopiscium sp. AS2M-Bin002]
MAKTITLPNGKKVTQKSSKFFIILIILMVMSYISVKITGFNFSTLYKRGIRFFDILIDMFPPDVEYLDFIWKPLFDTIKMSLLGSASGSFCAIPFAILASSNIVHNKFIILIIRLFLSLVRTLPTLIIALIATYMFGLGTMAGTTAIAVFTFAYIGKLLYEQIETVDMGAFEAMESFGATKLKSFMAAIVPQVLPSYIANCLFCFEGNVRYAAILGYVGAGGLGLILNEKIGWREYQSVGMILIVLFIAVVVIETVSHYFRKRLT